MKSKVNLTIDDSLLESVKAYASSKKISVSALVENYFRNITRPGKHRSIIEMVEELPEPAITVPEDIKENYYKEKSSKHGF